MIPFIKMHGCGNDYVFLDCFSNPIPKDPYALARSVSDRNRGVGGDGLILMLPSDIDSAVARMRMFNSDGTEGSLCGNALRCMAMWIHQSGKAGTAFRIVMGSRLMPVSILSSSTQDRTARVRIEIGAPEIQSPSASGRSAYLRSVDLSDLDLPALRYPPQFVSMGNPHAILYVNTLEEVDFFRLGPAIECHQRFPNRTNVEFVEIQNIGDSGPPRVKVRVWERGSGETMACGSGACAVAVAGLASGLLQHKPSVEVLMRGGELGIAWDESNTVYLEGPAEEAFRGLFPG